VKKAKALIILSLILLLTVTGCSDFYNWLSEDIDRTEEGQYGKKIEDETEIETEALIYFDDEEELTDPYKDTGVENKDTYGNNAFFDDEVEYIDSYGDAEIEKRDVYGNKTYYESR